MFDQGLFIFYNLKLIQGALKVFVYNYNKWAFRGYVDFVVLLNLNISNQSEYEM